MYYAIVVKWLSQQKKVTLPALKDKQSFTSILRRLFDLKDQEIIGITNKSLKFYDIESFVLNLQSFDKKTISIVTSASLNQQEEAFPQIEDQNEFNIEPISFASNTPNEFQNDYNPLNNDSELYEHAQLPEEPETQIIAQIHDIKIFEQMFLNDQITIIVESSKRMDHLTFPHYHLKGKNKKICIYQNKKKVCELPIFTDNWKETQTIVFNLLKSLQNIDYEIQSLEKQSNSGHFFSTEPQIKISNSRRKSVASQKKKRGSSNQQKQKSKQQLEKMIRKPKNEKDRKCELFAKKQSLSQQSQQPERYQIPIIIRKSNNQIETVTASYPLSHEQMQAINSLLELQIQGLFSDEQINKIKMMVLGENDVALKLFDSYIKQKINIGELSNNLAILVRKKDIGRK